MFLCLFATPRSAFSGALRLAGQRKPHRSSDGCGLGSEPPLSDPYLWPWRGYSCHPKRRTPCPGQSLPATTPVANWETAAEQQWGTVPKAPVACLGTAHSSFPIGERVDHRKTRQKPGDLRQKPFRTNPRHNPLAKTIWPSDPLTDRIAQSQPLGGMVSCPAVY